MPSRILRTALQCCDPNASYPAIVFGSQHNILNKLGFRPEGTGTFRRCRNTSPATDSADPARRQPFDPKRGVGAYFVRRAQAHGLIVRVLGGDVIAFSPPLIISEAQIDEVVEKTRKVIRAVK